MILTATGVPAVLAFAYVGERVGFRLVMAAGGLCAALATATALVAGRPAHFYLVFVLSGLAASCDFLSAMNMVIELSPDRDKTVYQAIYNTVLVPGRIGYPLLAGFLAEQFGIAAVFRAALALQIAGVLAVVLLVREARGR
jgi:MFS family permease